MRFCLTVSISALLVIPAGFTRIPAPQERTVLSDDRDAALLVSVERVLYEPDSDPLIARTTDVAARDDRVYVLDAGDRDVKVLSTSGEHLLTFGRPGQGPGEFESPSKLSIDETGRVFVYERISNEVEVFDLEGELLFGLRIPGLTYPPLSFQVAPDDLLVVGGASLSPELHSYGVHVFRMQRGAEGRWGVHHVRSFADVPDVDPGIYEEVAGGNALVDRDGNVVFAQLNPYRVAKYTLEGEEIWSHEEDGVMVPYSEFLEVQPNGSARLSFFPRSLILQQSGDGYVHQMISPPDEYAVGEATPLDVITELIPADGDGRKIRRFRGKNLPVFREFFGEGRAYGVMNPYSERIVRLQIELTAHRR